MKKTIIVLSSLFFVLTGCTNNDITKNFSDNYLKSDENIVSTDNTASATPQATKLSAEVETPAKTEEKIGEYSTKIYDKDDERQNNLGITCSKVNDSIIKAGDTFSFCDTVRKSNS